MNTNYSQTGNYVAIAGLAVTILAHFGVNITVDQIAGVIGGAVTLYGIIHQFIMHRNLAIATGSIK